MNGRTKRFVLRRERQVDEQQADGEDVDRLASGLDLLERQPGPCEAESLRQRALRQRLHLLDRLAGAEPGRRAAVDLGRAEQVVVADDLRRRRLAHAHDVGERHHAAAVGRARSTAPGPRVGPERLVGLHVDAVGAVVEIEVVHVRRPQVDLHRAGDLADRQAEAARLVAVDVDGQLRIVRRERAEQARDPLRSASTGRSAPTSTPRAGRRCRRA